MSQVNILDDELWPGVPAEVVEEAKREARDGPRWIAKREDGHFVSVEGPGSPDVATGDLVFIAEVNPAGE